jgi:hypothetical protein
MADDVTEPQLEPQTAAVYNCVCGHRERDHQWKSVENPIFTRTGECSNAVRLPREGDEPNVRYKVCGCPFYIPSVPLTVENCEEKGKRHIWAILANNRGFVCQTCRYIYIWANEVDAVEATEHRDSDT